MAHIQLTRGNGETGVDKESSVIIAIVDEGTHGTGVTVAIEGASAVDIAATISSMEATAERLKRKYPVAAMLLEFKKQADELKKEDEERENATDD